MILQSGKIQGKHGNFLLRVAGNPEPAIIREIMGVVRPRLGDERAGRLGRFRRSSVGFGNSDGTTEAAPPASRGGRSDKPSEPVAGVGRATSVNPGELGIRRCV